ncbi:MAG: DNA primase [Patescibacteria group bacterium]
MADQVDEIKQKTDIVSLISEYIDLKKAGRNYRALCPFHSEKTPSFMVSSELQIFKCFGCSESGDAYAFLQKYEGMDFPEALKFLADRTGVKLDQGSFKKSEGKQKIYEINKLTSKFYNYILLKHRVGSAALSYLTRERGINPNTIKTYRLGYSPDRPGVLEKFLLEKKGFHKGDLNRAGLVYTKGSRIFDRFAGRVIFPLLDHRGNVSGFAGRLLPKSKNDGMAKYINTPETIAYQKSRLLYGLNLVRDEIKKKREAVVVEGELDAISSWQAGVKNVVAIKGSALTQDQASLVRRFAEKVVLALDADMAGNSANRRGISIAEKAGLEVEVARLGEFKDPDEMAQKSPAKLKSAIKGAVGVWDFIFDSIFEKYDPEKGVEKARISREIVPVLSDIEDKIVQSHYAQLVAKRLAVTQETVLEQVNMVSSKKVTRRKVVPSFVKAEAKPRRELLENRLMALFFQADSKVLLKKEIKTLITMPLAVRILAEYGKYAKKNIKFDPSEFAARLPKELVNGFANLILRDDLGERDSPSVRKRELELVKRELKVLTIKDKLKKLAGEIRTFEDKNQNIKLKTAEKKFSKLSQELTKLEEAGGRGIIL